MASVVAALKAGKTPGPMDSVIEMIERTAKARFPNKSQMDERFDYRNQLRAQAGLPPEKKTRGGLAGVYDRNDHIIKPILTVAATVAAPYAVGALAPITNLLPSGVSAALPKLLPTGPANMLISTSGISTGIKGAVGGLVGGILTSAADKVISRITGGGGGGAPPALPFGATPMPRPIEGVIGRTISRILPGGMTGREWTPATDMTDRVGRPLAVHPAVRESVVGPAGYVVVTMPNGERVAMLRAFAIRAGLYKPAPKPPVSGWDMRAIKRAASASKRVKKLAGKVGFSCAKKGR